MLKKDWSTLFSRDLSKCKCSLNVKDEDYPINAKNISWTESQEKSAISDGSDTYTGSYIIVKNNTDQEMTVAVSVFGMEKELGNTLNESYNDDSEEEITLNIYNPTNKTNQAITCYLKQPVIQDNIETGGTNNTNTTLHLGTMDRKAVYEL